MLNNECIYSAAFSSLQNALGIFVQCLKGVLCNRSVFKEHLQGTLPKLSKIVHSIETKSNNARIGTKRINIATVVPELRRVPFFCEQLTYSQSNRFISGSINDQTTLRLLL